MTKEFKRELVFVTLLVISIILIGFGIQINPKMILFTVGVIALISFFAMLLGVIFGVGNRSNENNTRIVRERKD